MIGDRHNSEPITSNVLKEVPQEKCSLRDLTDVCVCLTLVREVAVHYAGGLPDHTLLRAYAIFWI